MLAPHHLRQKDSLNVAHALVKAFAEVVAEEGIQKGIHRRVGVRERREQLLEVVTRLEVQ